MTSKADIVILGSGPGGYVAAIRAAQLGAQVVLVEKAAIGGVCLNVGCIPTKALLRSAEVFRAFQHAGDFGIQFDGNLSPDWAAIQARKAKIVQRLVGGVDLLLRKAKVQVIQGAGQLVSPTAVEVATKEGTQRIEASKIIVATGSRPVSLPLPGMDLPGVIDSTGALALDALPERMLIIGGGVIGVEFADVFSAFGVEVTIVEMLDQLLPLMDSELGQTLARALKKRKIKLYLDSQVTSIEQIDGGLRALIKRAKSDVTVDADKVLVAVGRRPNTEDIGLESTGVKYDKAGIPVNEQMQTSVSSVYAIGDVTGAALLAHVASLGGEVAVEHALGHESHLDLKTVPSCVYTDPEVASVGLTKARAEEQGYKVQIGKFPLSANGKALTYGESQGFIKVVSDARYGEILGLHIIGPHACDLIHEGGLALTLEATTDEIINTIHAHPTLGEAIREATMETRAEAIHLPR